MLFRSEYKPQQHNGCVTLYKEETSKLFEARVYSDFVGLDGKAANGLLQTEVAKRLNLNTTRIGGKGWFRNVNFGYLSWIEPTMTLSKIENTNKYLALKQAAPIDSSGRNRFYATTLDIRQHEALSIGTRLNLVYVDLPKYKSTLSVNVGAYYGRTPISVSTIDTTTNNGLNTVTVFPEFTCDTRADERWGLSLSYRPSFMRILSRDIVQIADLLDPQNKLSPNIVNRSYSTAQFQVFFQASEENRGRLFFRYRYHWQSGDQNLGFHQAQVGYSFYLLGRNKGTATGNK